VRVGVDIKLHDLDRAGVLLCQLLDLGGDKPTGAAPGCPEIDDHRLLVLQDELVPVGVSRLLNVGQWS
jgi:hypothetical protein